MEENDQITHVSPTPSLATSQHPTCFLVSPQARNSEQTPKSFTLEPDPPDDKDGKAYDKVFANGDKTRIQQNSATAKDMELA